MCRPMTWASCKRSIPNASEKLRREKIKCWAVLNKWKQTRFVPARGSTTCVASLGAGCDLKPGIDSCHRSMEVFMGLFAPALISTICPCSDQSLALRYCGGSSLRQKTDPDLSNIGQKWWVHYLAVESSFFDWKMASFTIESSSFVYKTDLYPIAYLHMQKDRQRSHKIAIDQGQSTRLIEKQKRDSVCCFCSTTFPLCLSLLWHSAYGPSLFVEI